MILLKLWRPSAKQALMININDLDGNKCFFRRWSWHSIILFIYLFTICFFENPSIFRLTFQFQVCCLFQIKNIKKNALKNQVSFFVILLGYIISIVFVNAKLIFISREYCNPLKVSYLMCWKNFFRLTLVEFSCQN